MSFDCNKHIA